jgi:hypothetical protein
MYGLPRNFDASVFVGQELSLVSFSANTINLVFDDQHSITMESSFAYTTSANTAEIEQAIPGISSGVMGLLGKTVVRAESHENGLLVLSFEGGGVITCRDDSDDYESYHICIGEKQIDV